MKAHVTCIIIHWNTPADLRQQLATLKSTPELKIVVVDNASEGGVSSLKKKFSKVSFIENQTNHGFARACNQGMEVAHTKWLLFLNPDVAVDASSVAEMIQFAENYSLDAVSPEPSPEQKHLYKKPLPTAPNLLIEFSPLHRLFKPFGRKHTLTGGCLLIKKSVLKEVGGWDEDFFLWFEDSDLTKRLYKAKKKLGWYPHSVDHRGGQSVKTLSKHEQKRLFFQSMQLYAKKHFTISGRLLVRLLRRMNTAKSA